MLSRVRRGWIIVGGLVLGVGAWWAATWPRRRERWERRSFLAQYRAATHGLLPVGELRTQWEANLERAQSRYGAADTRTVVARCRVLALAALAGDIGAGIRHIDAILEGHDEPGGAGGLASLGEEERWIALAGLAWVERHKPSARRPGRCLRAYEAVASASLATPALVEVALHLARTAADCRAVEDARSILDRAAALTGDRVAEDGSAASPYRRPDVAEGPARDEAFEVRCERVRVEIIALQLTEARAAQAELERWIAARPDASSYERGRAAQQRGLVFALEGDYVTALPVLAEAAARLSDGNRGAGHRVSALLARADLLLELQRLEDASEVARTAETEARRLGHGSAEARARLANALVRLGEDAEAESLLEGLGEGTPGGVVAGQTRALLDLRRGAPRAARRHALAALARVDARGPAATDAWLTLARVLVASGMPRRAERLARVIAGRVIATLGPTHPKLVAPYRFLAERCRGRGAAAAACSLDEAADRLGQGDPHRDDTRA